MLFQSQVLLYFYNLCRAGILPTCSVVLGEKQMDSVGTSKTEQWFYVMYLSIYQFLFVAGRSA